MARAKSSFCAAPPVPVIHSEASPEPRRRTPNSELPGQWPVNTTTALLVSLVSAALALGRLLTTPALSASLPVPLA